MTIHYGPDNRRHSACGHADLHMWHVLRVANVDGVTCLACKRTWLYREQASKSELYREARAAKELRQCIREMLAVPRSMALCADCIDEPARRIYEQVCDYALLEQQRIARRYNVEEPNDG